MNLNPRRHRVDNNAKHVVEEFARDGRNSGTPRASALDPFHRVCFADAGGVGHTSVD